MLILGSAIENGQKVKKRRIFSKKREIP